MPFLLFLLLSVQVSGNALLLLLLRQRTNNTREIRQDRQSEVWVEANREIGGRRMSCNTRQKSNLYLPRTLY